MSSITVTLTINSKSRITPQEIAESVAYLFKNNQFGYEKPAGIMAVSGNGNDGRSAWVPLESLAGGQ